MRDGSDCLNIFLVILNAEIKCHRYFEMIKPNPPTNPLPSDVINLMSRTVELVNLLYWEPTPTRGSRGEQVVAAKLANSRKDQGRATRPGPQKYIERGSSEGKEMVGEEREMEMDEDVPSNAWASSRHKKFRWPAHMDLKARVAYGRALMCGPDLDYDPALFENAFPINYTPDMYNERSAVEAWQQTVSSDN